MRILMLTAICFGLAASARAQCQMGDNSCYHQQFEQQQAEQDRFRQQQFQEWQRNMQERNWQLQQQSQQR